MIKSIISGFGRTFGRFLFYVLLGLLAYLIFDNWEVKAVNYTLSQTGNYGLQVGTIDAGPITRTEPTIQYQQFYYYYSNGAINLGSQQLSLTLYNLQINATPEEINNSDYILLQSKTEGWYPALNTSITGTICNSRVTGYAISSMVGVNQLSDGTTDTSLSTVMQIDTSHIKDCTMGNNTPGTFWFNFSYSHVNINTYFKFYLSKNVTLGYNSSQLGQIVSNQNQINTNINNINTSLNDDTTLPDASVSEITDIGIGSDITGNARFSDIVLLAPQVLQHLLIDSNTCVQVNLGQLYNTNLYLPCIQPINYLGSSIWGVIDVIFCIALLFPFIQWLVNTIYKIIGLDRLDPTFGFSEAVNK